jgi:threonine dehydratase
VPLAAVLLAGPAVAGRRVGIVFSGGNLDLDALPALFAAARGRPDRA